MAIDGRAVYRRITWRLIPYLFILYILAYLDRVNVGFAAIEMQRDLHLSNTVYGIGGGIFFIGSALFDLPSNLLLGKYGPRLWIARIMMTWGVIATAMALVVGPHSFYLLRFLLGVSEAGFFPGIILYLTYWFPSQERARAVAKFMTATSLAGVVGGPLSSFLLNLEGRSGLHGWQWLFLVEGVPSVVMGVSVLFLLNDRPDDAAWLSAEEKVWLDGEIERDRQEGGAAGRHNLKDAFKLPMVWVIAAFYTVSQIGVYTVNLWMPKVLNSFVHSSGAQAAQDAALIARYSTLPYLMAAICTVLVGWSSDRMQERKKHVAGCLLLAAVGFAWVAVAQSMVAALCAFTLAAVGLWSMMGPFWVLPTRVLGGRAAAGGVAIIVVLGGIGASLGPAITGWMRDLTNSYNAGLYLISGLAVLGAGLCLSMKDKRPT
jgi:ACS family tartrate transporter-like MFS transporter